MPKDTKTLGNNKARACESLGFVHKKRLCQRFDTTSFCFYIRRSVFTVSIPMSVPVYSRVWHTVPADSATHHEYPALQFFLLPVQ